MTILCYFKTSLVTFVKSEKNEKKQHNEGNMALRIISILTH